IFIVLYFYNVIFWSICYTIRRRRQIIICTQLQMAYRELPVKFLDGFGKTSAQIFQLIIYTFGFGVFKGGIDNYFDKRIFLFLLTRLGGWGRIRIGIILGGCFYGRNR